MNNIMPTQTSQLIQNLTTIYNTKLEIKSVLGTNSDDFTEYPDLIEAAISEGGGGSGSSADPWYDYTDTYEIIENEKSSADYVRTNICDNFEYKEENGEYTISWDEIQEIETKELDQNDEPILEEKTIHVVLTGDPHEIYSEGSNIASALEDYKDLYYSIYPILENATLTESSNPSEDGYDYLLEGDLYAWNLSENCGQVQEITENNIYVNTGEVGFNINVNIERQDNYHIFDLRATAWPMLGTTQSIDVAEIQNYNQLIYHSGFNANYVNPVTSEESTNSYYNFEITGANHAAISGLTPFDVFNDSISDIQMFEYNGQSSAYVDNIDIYHNVYTEELDPDTGDPIPNWDHTNIAYWGAEQGQHCFELEPGDYIYVTSYTMTVGNYPVPIVYKDGVAIWSKYADNAMWPYEEE